VRILHLSWEYPPVVYGGLGRHVHALAEHQAAQGHEVVVLTQLPDSDVPGDETVQRVRIVRVPSDAPFVPLDETNLMAWVFGFNSALTRAGIALQRSWAPDVIHGHDWLVAQSATALKDVFRTAYVTTLHATEAGRHQGWLPTPLSRAIHSVEWWSTYQARRVIACSEHMRWEVNRLFTVPEAKTIVIPNGIDPAQLRVTPTQRRTIQDRYGDVTVVFSGRLEWEKGIHTLIDAMRSIRRTRPTATLVIAGRGSKEDELREQVKRHRLGRAIRFAGWLPETELHALVAQAQVAVVPSLYEPFGIVALEAAALGTPLVVSRAGGLAEFVEDGVTGRVFEPGQGKQLADAVHMTLDDPRRARSMARKAKQRVIADYGWAAIAQQTCEVYGRAIKDEDRLIFDRTGYLQPPAVPEGNLLWLSHGT
jgi:glycogen(starch) synthase